MRKTFYIFAISIAFVALAGAASLGLMHIKGVRAAPAVTCTPTGFMRDSINLTAALINPPGIVHGTVNATGCNIGVYYGSNQTGIVKNAEIFEANYFGIVNDGGTVKVLQSRIHDIGESPLNGDQHGIGIYFAFGTPATGEIADNRIWNYQKGGIVVNSSSRNFTEISHNTVIGQGPVSYIAQNGIQVGYGAKAKVIGNTVTGNSYTGAGLTASGGIIVVGGDCYGGPVTTDTQIVDNVVKGNDVGIWLSNLDSNCGPTSTSTDILVRDNTSTNDAINNTTGNGVGQGYQAGISDQGNHDRIISNRICGIGYTSPSTSSIAIFAIDVTATNNPIVYGNIICGKNNQRHSQRFEGWHKQFK